MLASRLSRVALILLLALMFLLGGATSAAAADIRSGDTLTVAQGEVIDDDLFVSASRIVIDGTVNGNLIALGSELEVNGTVGGSLIAAAQSVVINGRIDGSVYAAASSSRLGPKAVIARNGMLALSHLTTETGSSIQRDLYVAGAQAVLDGQVGRDVNFAGAALEVSGQIGRNVRAQVAEPGTAIPAVAFGPGVSPTIAGGIRVSPEATIGGRLEYTSPVEQSGAIQAKPAAGVSYILRTTASPRPAEPNAFLTFAGWVLDLLREFVTLFVLGLLALWKLPDLATALAARAQAHPVQSAGWGLVVWIGGFVLAFIAAVLVIALAILFGVITLGGLASTILGVGFSALGFAFTLFMLLVSYGAKLIVAYLAGKVILAQFKVTDHRVWALVLGVSILVVVTTLPLLGWLVGSIATLVGLGALWLTWRDRQQPKAALQPTA